MILTSKKYLMPEFYLTHELYTVVHTIKVEPLSIGLEQSMQYNELYVPSNPRPNQSKTRTSEK